MHLPVGIRDGRDFDLLKALESAVDRGEVLLDDDLSELAVRLLDRLFYRTDRLLEREGSGEREEARLEDGVGALTESGGLCRGVGVDDEEPEFLGDDLLLDFLRQLVPDFVRPVGAVEQERGPFLRDVEHVDLHEELELMTGDEVGVLDQVRRSDRVLVEPQMGGRHGSRLARVVHEIALGEQWRVLTEDLHRVLVRTDRSVAPESVEHGTRLRAPARIEVWIDIQAETGHVVDDPDRETTFRLGFRCLREYRRGMGRSELLRRQPVPSTDDPGRYLPRRATGLGLLDHGHHDVLQEGIADRAGFLGAIEHRDVAHRRRQ